MSERIKIICLLTDFGLRDGYVSSMKGVIYSIAPHVTIVDISHDIDPFCISSGAYVLYSVVPYFPSNTIFVAVVDPGVGTERKALVVEKQGNLFIGPDNGLFSWILAEGIIKAFWIDPKGLSSPYVKAEISSTFHGRDIFAPIAAHIARGVNVEELAIPLDTPPLISDWIAPKEHSTHITGQVVHVDRFGNLVTNIKKEHFSDWKKRHLPHSSTQGKPIVEIRSHSMSIEETYGSVPKGALTALWGSSNHLEISVNQGHAAKRLSVSYLETVRIRIT
ncbi:MAG: SAM-dependent chlorinase/fluorinase [Syntrophobacterales bacterium]|nr:SAM-dependent chlorinase/fluorinase [Syntrophobacterales bacterium]